MFVRLNTLLKFIVRFGYGVSLADGFIDDVLRYMADQKSLYSIFGWPS